MFVIIIGNSRWIVGKHFQNFQAIKLFFLKILFQTAQLLLVNFCLWKWLQIETILHQNWDVAYLRITIAISWPVSTCPTTLTLHQTRKKQVGHGTHSHKTFDPSFLWYEKKCCNTPLCWECALVHILWIAVIWWNESIEI